MAIEHHTRRFARTEEPIITLFCLVDDAYPHLNPPPPTLRVPQEAIGFGGQCAGPIRAELRGIESGR
jgi:hypothetical protein